MTTTVRVYPADEPKAGPAKPRGRPRKRVPGSDAAVAVAAGPERRIEESKDVRKKSIQVSNTKAPVVVPVPRVGPRPDPVARPPPLDARVGPPLGLAASASAANLAKPVARVRDDDEHAAAENENTDAAFESPSKEGSSSKEEVTSPLPRRLAVSPPRRPFAAANENAPRSAAPPPANATPAGAPPPRSYPFGARPRRCLPAARPTRTRPSRPRSARASGRLRVRRRRRERASPPHSAPRLAGGPVLVMVGDKAVAPAARDRSVNRRKPASGRRAALPHGVHPTSPPKRVVRRTSNTLSRLWETETRR